MSILYLKKQGVCFIIWLLGLQEPWFLDGILTNQPQCLKIGLRLVNSNLLLVISLPQSHLSLAQIVRSVSNAKCY